MRELQMRVAKTKSGTIILGRFPSEEVISKIWEELGEDRAGLAILDPPYGNIVSDSWDRYDTVEEFVRLMFTWIEATNTFLLPNSAIMLWGGIGRPNFRPLYSFLSAVEGNTDLTIANHITWGKKRAYGVQNNYLFTREELIYLTNGNPKRPRVFNIPLLDELRGYPGYNDKYPAKSEYKRRTNVWSDITELLRDKLHDQEKPEKAYKVIVEAHSNPGDIIIDPFAGSGTTGAVAMETGRRYILVENDRDCFETCCWRLGGIEQ